MRPGEWLRAWREALDISTKEVERQSKRIAARLGSRKYLVSSGWLSRLERFDLNPTISKLTTISLIYGVPLDELARLFRLESKKAALVAVLVDAGRTRLGACEPSAHPPPGMSTERERTALIGAIDAASAVGWPLPWPDIVADHRKRIFGRIGRRDAMMQPLLPQGSIVMIDTEHRSVDMEWPAHTPRPIYFVQLHGGYACCWCERHSDALVLLPHPESRQMMRRVSLGEVSVVGRVIGFAASLIQSEVRSAPRAAAAGTG